MNVIVRLATLALLAAVPYSTAWATDAVRPAAPGLQQERMHCRSGQSQQDEAACLKEVQAAHDEARRNGLATPGAAQRSGHAVERCRVQPPQEQAACVERITAGATDGSVGGGGLIRRSKTTTTP